MKGPLFGIVVLAVGIGTIAGSGSCATSGGAATDRTATFPQVGLG